MQLRSTKAAFTALWIVAVLVVMVTSRMTSVFSILLGTVLAAIPPAVFWQLWNPPAASVSDDIREILKD